MFSKKRTEQIMRDEFGVPAADRTGDPAVPETAQAADAPAPAPTSRPAPAVTAEPAQTPVPPEIGKHPSDGPSRADLIKRGEKLLRELELEAETEGVIALKRKNSIYSTGDVTGSEDSLEGKDIRTTGSVNITQGKPNTKATYLGLDPIVFRLREFIVIRRIVIDGNNTLAITAKNGTEYRRSSQTEYDKRISRKPVFIFRIGKALYVYSDNTSEGYVRIGSTPCKNGCFEPLPYQSDISVGNALFIKIYDV